MYPTAEKFLFPPGEEPFKGSFIQFFRSIFPYTHIISRRKHLNFVQEHKGLVVTLKPPSKIPLKTMDDSFLPLLRCHRKYMVNRIYPWKISKKKASFELVFKSHQILIGARYLDKVKSVFKSNEIIEITMINSYEELENLTKSRCGKCHIKDKIIKDLEFILDGRYKKS